MSLLQDQLNRVSYKPGYEFRGRVIPHFEVRDHQVEGDLWLIRVEKPNNIDAETGGTRHSTGRWNVVIGHSVDEVARTCLVAIKNFEEHECYEFLRLDGGRLFSPHGVG